MNVRLLFFAVLRDITGASEHELTLVDGATPRQVWSVLRTKYPKLAGYAEPPLIAINEEYATADTPLRAGDELAFIPPVAGG